MKSYMVLYRTEGSAGRFFVNTTSDGLPTADQIEEWQRLCSSNFGHKDPMVIGFHEVAYPAVNAFEPGKPAPDVAGLVEALRAILGWRELRSGNEVPITRIERIASVALAAYQSGGAES